MIGMWLLSILKRHACCLDGSPHEQQFNEQFQSLLEQWGLPPQVIEASHVMCTNRSFSPDHARTIRKFFHEFGGRVLALQQQLPFYDGVLP